MQLCTCINTALFVVVQSIETTGVLAAVAGTVAIAACIVTIILYPIYFQHAGCPQGEASCNFATDAAP